MKSILKFFYGGALTFSALFLIAFSTVAAPTKLIDRNYDIQTEDYFLIPSDTASSQILVNWHCQLHQEPNIGNINAANFKITSSSGKVLVNQTKTGEYSGNFYASPGEAFNIIRTNGSITISSDSRGPCSIRRSVQGGVTFNAPYQYNGYTVNETTIVSERYKESESFSVPKNLLTLYVDILWHCDLINYCGELGNFKITSNTGETVVHISKDGNSFGTFRAYPGKTYSITTTTPTRYQQIGKHCEGGINYNAFCINEGTFYEIFSGGHDSYTDKPFSQNNTNDVCMINLPSNSLAPTNYTCSKSQDLNTVSQVNPFNEPIRVYWKGIKLAPQGGPPDGSPYIKITLNLPNGTKSTVVEQNLDTEVFGTFQLPPLTCFTVEMNNGGYITEQWSTNQANSHSYPCEFKIYYRKLDKGLPTDLMHLDDDIFKMYIDKLAKKAFEENLKQDLDFDVSLDKVDYDIYNDKVHIYCTAHNINITGIKRITATITANFRVNSDYTQYGVYCEGINVNVDTEWWVNPAVFILTLGSMSIDDYVDDKASKFRGLQYWVDADFNKVNTPPTDFKYLTKDVIDNLIRAKVKAKTPEINYEIPIDNIGKIKFDVIDIAETVQLNLTTGKFYAGCSIIGTLILNNGVEYPLSNQNLVTQFDLYHCDTDLSLWARFRGFSKLNLGIPGIDSDAVMISINKFFENNTSYTIPYTGVTLNFYAKISQ